MRIIEACRFPEPGGRSGLQALTKANAERACEFLQTVRFKPHDEQSPGMSRMPVLIGYDD